MKNPDISVVICTLNRFELLKKCIESIICQDIEDISYDIIVIDNNSKDSTSEFCIRLQREGYLRYHIETKIGLSYARNRGLQEAKGGNVAFIDDDAVASPGWLKALQDTFADPSVGSAGGPIFPIFNASLPKWYNESLLPLYSCRDRGIASYDLPPRQFFYGVNMAFRKKLLLKIGGFPINLGRKGSNLLSDEEMYIFRSLDRLCTIKRYTPGACVYHNIPKERLTLKWVLRRFYWMGKGEAILDMYSKKRPPERVYHKGRLLLKQIRQPKYKAGLFSCFIPLSHLIGYSGSTLFNKS